MKPIIDSAKGTGVLLAALLLAGCASSAMPSTQLQQQMARSTSAVTEAEEVGAHELAPVALRDAEQKLERAQEAMAKEKFELAERLAVQAEVDAELAEVTALSEKTKLAVRELKETIRTLREEIARNSSGRQ